MAKSYKEHIPRISLAVIGIALVLMSIFADEIGIGEGPKNFGFSQWVILVAGIAMMIIGIASSQLSLIVAVNLLVLIPILLLVDNVLYFASPWLPASVARTLSTNAKIKYELKHWEDMPFVIRDGGISYYKPYSITQKKDGTYFFDEFGYRNPPNYITQFNPDIILLGDSYTEGYTKTTIADYLRRYLAPKKIYSLGISGQGPQHWKIQFHRYVNSNFFRAPPKMVVLNFFSGNDISDLTTCKPGKDHTNEASIKPDPPKQKFSFFGEIFAIVRHVLYYQKTASLWQTEPISEEVANPIVAEVFSEVIKEIRSAAPSAVILLSNISTTEAIYGPDMERCMGAFRSLGAKGDYPGACKTAASRQLANSNLLRKLAESLKIEYLDPTPVLRAAAARSLLHHENLHFNDEGNRIYSEEVTKKLKDLVAN